MVWKKIATASILVGGLFLIFLGGLYSLERLCPFRKYSFCPWKLIKDFEYWNCYKGNVSACNYLGWLYVEGLGVKKNYSKAFKYFKLACNKENGAGCNNLGILYERGLGVKKNYKKALKFFKISCDKGLNLGCQNAKILKNLLF